MGALPSMLTAANDYATVHSATAGHRIHLLLEQTNKHIDGQLFTC